MKNINKINLNTFSFSLFVLSYIFYGFHILRNLFSLYIAFPVVLIFFSIILTFSVVKRLDRLGFYFVAAFIILTFYPIFISLFTSPIEDVLVPIFRYLYLIPILFGSTIIANRPERLRIILSFYIALVVFGAFSLFYQVSAGPVFWFADASERDGLVRYSSILGNLTVMGVAGGLALPAIYFMVKDKILKIFLIVIVATGMFFTLQKAAVANILIFLVLVSLDELFEKKIRIIFFAFILIIAFSFFAIYFEFDYVISTVNNFIRIDKEVTYSDVSFYQSVVDRIWNLPSELYYIYGVVGILLGVGVIGGGGVLGFSNYPMAHNMIFDYLFIGGLPYLVSFGVIYFLTIKRFYFKTKQKNSTYIEYYKAAYHILLMLLINIPFSSGLQYQPVTGSLLYCLIGYATMTKLSKHPRANKENKFNSVLV